MASSLSPLKAGVGPSVRSAPSTASPDRRTALAVPATAASRTTVSSTTVGRGWAKSRSNRGDGGPRTCTSVRYQLPWSPA